MFCPYCGKSNDDENLFCEHCGKALPQKRGGEVKSAIEEPAPVEEQELPPAEPAAKEHSLMEEPQPEHSPPASTVENCPNCRSPLPPSKTGFCPGCGFPITNGERVLAVPEMAESAEFPRVPPVKKTTREQTRMPKLPLMPKLKLWMGLPVLLIGVIIAGLFIRGRASPIAQPYFEIETASGSTCKPMEVTSRFEESNIHDLQGRLDQDTIFKANTEYYISDGQRLTVPKGTTLLIEPGAIVKFGQSSQLWVEGELQACGQKSRRILFTADADTGRPGYWNGIMFDHADASSVLGHASFEYAGGGQIPVVYMTGTGVSIEDLKFDNNAFYPVGFTPDSFPNLLPPFEVKNGPKGWLVNDGTLSKDLTWSGAQPLVINGRLRVDSKVVLTLQAGSQVKFMPNAQLQVYGHLRAIGTSDKHIVVTSTNDLYGSSNQPNADQWSGLLFFGDRSSAELVYVDYHYEANSAEDQ